MQPADHDVGADPVQRGKDQQVEGVRHKGGEEEVQAAKRQRYDHRAKHRYQHADARFDGNHLIRPIEHGEGDVHTKPQAGAKQSVKHGEQDHKHPRKGVRLQHGGKGDGGKQGAGEHDG